MARIRDPGLVHRFAAAYTRLRAHKGTRRMGLSDRVLRLGDYAVNPDPTAEHLAGIAIPARQRTGTPGGAPRATPQGCIPLLSVAPTPGAGTVPRR